jgi:AsmA protein
MTAPLPKRRRWPKLLAAFVVGLLLAGVVAAFMLDRLLTSAARDQATRLSALWQRPVEVGAVRTRLLTGLGLRVEGVKIGAATGEGSPLLELDRIEVRLELLRALRSKGKELHIQSAELQGVRVNVVKLEAGGTNLERFAATLSKGDGGTSPGPAGPPAGAEEKPVDLSGVRIDHLALLDGRVAFIDRSSAGPELFVERIELVVDGLAAGRPLEVLLKAAVLSSVQNLELRVHAPPLPPTLVPSPDRVTLKVAPIDLTPMARFTPRQAGFQGGRFSADLEVALGSAVPGGVGATTVNGGFKATGLRFDGQQGGRALDVTLDAALTADAVRGDLDITRLLLAFGPASIEGRGKVSGLLTESPRVEGLRLVARNVDLAALAPWYPPLPRLLGGTVAGPIGLSVEATGTAERPVVELRADLTPVRLDFPHRLVKAAGGPLTLLARVRGAGAGGLRFELEGDLGGLDLRPGGTLDKRPGDRLRLAAAGSRTTAGGGSRLELASFSLAIVELSAKGRATVQLAPGRTGFEVDADVDRIDIDRLLLQAAPAPAPALEAGAAPARPGASPWAGLSGVVALRIGEVTSKKQKLTAVRAKLELKEDQVTFTEGRFGIWSGTVDLAGTQARLAPADRPFKLKARIEQVQLAALLAAFTEKKVADARLDAEVALAGKGEGSGAIMKALDGTIEGKLQDGVFHGKDLVAEVMAPVVKAVPSLKGNLSRGGTTSLGKLLPFSLRVQGGQARLQRPIEVTDRGSTLSAEGAFGFDGELDMPTTLALSPAAVADVTGGKARVDRPLPFAFKLEGKAWNPRITGLDVQPAVRTLAESVGLQALGRALGLPASPAAPAAGGAPAPAGGAPATAADPAAAKQRAREEADAKRKELEKAGEKALKGLLGR